MATRFDIEAATKEQIELLGEAYVSILESDKLVYSTDWSWMHQMWLDRDKQATPPDIIVHPGSAEEIAEIMKLANRHRLPVVPWGGGSGSQGGAGPILGGILLDTKRLNQIIEINEYSLTVTA